MTGEATQVIDNQEQHRFELPLGGDQTAVAYYQIDGNRVLLTHTEVPKELSGQGIGSRLARGVFEAIRASGRKAVPRCPFMHDFVARHPEYSDVVES